MRTLGACCALTLVLSSCTGSGGGNGAARIVASSGTVEMRVEGGAWELAEGEVGEHVELRLEGEGSHVEITSGMGNLYFGVPGGDVAALLEIDGSNLALEFGDLLIAADEGKAATLSAPRGLSAMTEGGTVRLTISEVKRLAVYSGAASATLLGKTLTINSWRQVSFTNDRFAALIPPLQLDPLDPMDVFAASDVISLDADLETFMRGFEGQFGARIRSITELADIAADAQRRPFRFLERVMPTWRSGDVLCALVLALLLESESNLALGEAFAQIKELSDAGATWGVISAMLGLSHDTVVDRVARAIALRSGEVEPGRGDPINSPPPSTNSPRPSSTPTSSPTSRPSPTASPTKTNTPSPSPSPSSSVPPIPTPSPSTPSPSESCQPVDQIFGNC